MNKRRAIISTAVAISLVGLAAWAFGFFNRTDPAIAELQQIGSQMRDQNLSDAQRNQLRDDFRQRMGSLTDDQRRAFFDANRGQWNGRMQERMDEYFKMSKADQQKRLDDILNRIVQGRNAQQQNASGANQQNQNNGGRSANNRGGGRNTTEAQREQRSKQRLDRTTPRQRAEIAEFRKQLDLRAQQRGINLGNQSGWGGFPGGFGGGGGGRRGA